MPRCAGGARVVGGDDAGRLLAAVLERVQAEVGEVGRLVVPEDAEDAALVVELVGQDGQAHRVAKVQGSMLAQTRKSPSF